MEIDKTSTHFRKLVLEEEVKLILDGFEDSKRKIAIIEQLLQDDKDDFENYDNKMALIKSISRKPSLTSLEKMASVKKCLSDFHERNTQLYNVQKRLLEISHKNCDKELEKCQRELASIEQNANLKNVNNESKY